VPGGTSITSFINVPRYFFVAGLLQKMHQENNHIEIEDELKRFMELHNFESINDVLKVEPSILLKMDGFGYRLLNHLFNLNNTKGINGL